MNATAKRPSPAKGAAPYRDKYGDPIPCPIPGPCPCADPCRRIREMIENEEIKS